jgi:hypothetical protein
MLLNIYNFSAKIITHVPFHELSNAFSRHTLIKDPVCFVIDIVTVCISHLQKIIYVYNYANKTIFKHRRICKMCTAHCI